MSSTSALFKSVYVDKGENRISLSRRDLKSVFDDDNLNLTLLLKGVARLFKLSDFTRGASSQLSCSLVVDKLKRQKLGLSLVKSKITISVNNFFLCLSEPFKIFLLNPR